jgi:phosphoglycerate dehydrogenase-like enzyme
VQLTVLVPSDHLDYAEAAIHGHRLVPYRPGQPFPEDAARADVLIPPFLSGAQLVERIAELPKLRMVQLLTVGAESWLGRLPDGVALSTARGAHSAATAEWVLAVLLAGYRELPSFLADAAHGRWRPRATDGLFGKRVLVIGAGDVGSRVASRLLACDAEVTMVGRRGGDGVHPVRELPALLPAHDAVVLIVPLTEETRGMVDAAFLAAMPDGAMLVNAARGPVVHTDALLAELTGGRLRAALDVTDPEPLPPDHPLWTAPNVIITPHVGGSVFGLYQRAYRVAAAQIAALADGRQPDNLVRSDY